MHRRHFLRLGLGLGTGFGLSAVGLCAAPGRAAPPSTAGRAKAMVLLFMHGGMSQLDTFDPKPGRPTGGTFKAIDTTLPGARFSEHLPRLAARGRDLTVLRSLVAREGNHTRARYLMHTGFVPQGGVVHPSLGALVAARAEAVDVPGYVAIGREPHGSGYLGPRRSPFIVRRADQTVRNLSPAAGVGASPGGSAADRERRRASLLADLDGAFAARHASPRAETGMAMRAQAGAVMRGPAAAAFDLDRESGLSDALVRYGDGAFGRGCLMARRLVDAGVPFVEVQLPGWDTHDDNFNRVRALSSELDRGMSALLDDLRASGRFDDTIVACITDFGRTPRINGRGGRDHYPAAASALLGGGGLARGRVVGATDPDGYAVVDQPVGVPDLFRTLCERLGIEPDETHMTPEGRPVTTVDEDARRIDALLG